MPDLLNIGTTSLTAAQGALATISHNIANANTPGYSRQEAVLSTAGSQFTGAGFFGRGVQQISVRRQYDQFLTAAVQSNAATAASDAARRDALAELDGLFADPELGIGAAIDDTFAAAVDLANRPADMSVRQAFLSRLDQLAERTSTLGGRLAELGEFANDRIARSAEQVNSTLGEIKTLNARIATEQGRGQPPNDLLDQRDAALQSLNELIAVHAIAVPDGNINLFTSGGVPLLVGSQQSVLRTVPDPADNTRTALQLTVGAIPRQLDAAALGGGSLSGLMRFRDEDLAGATQQIGRLTLVLADRFNTQQAAGVDATGAAGVPLLAVTGPLVRPHSDNTGSAAVAATVSSTAALKVSDYRVNWDGSNYTVTRLSDGQATVTPTFPVTVDGLDFAATGSAAAGDSWLVRPYDAAATTLAARTVAPREVATGFAASIQPGAANQGSGVARSFQVVQPQPANSLAVTVTFNNPPTSFNVTGLSGGNLTNVAYVPGQRVPASGDYNGWSVVLDGTPATGDTFAVGPTVSPGSDNRNALALAGLADQKLVDGGTLNESYAALLGDTGLRVQSSRAAADISGRLRSEAVGRQQAVSGVNLDEEAANLLRYQQAYQAAAKVIQASQTMFDTLLSAAGH